jgi:tripartite-type tricarboxylate transporter receptor subunit TctC
LVAAAGAQAQSWPAKPLRLIIPWPPGGPADALARPINARLHEALSQPVIIDNRPGANGSLGFALAARAPADGYTLLQAHLGPVALNPALQREKSYDPVRDFEPITLLAGSTSVLAIRAELPMRSVPELIAYARAKPGSLSYGSIGTGSTTHLAGEMLRRMSAIDILHVPYKGAAPVVTELLGGHIDIAVIGISIVTPHVQTGKLRAIAVSRSRRSALMPDLPTIAETLPGFEMNSWYGLMAPAGTPNRIVARLHEETARILKAPELNEQLQRLGMEPDGMAPAAFATKIRDEIARYANLVKAIGLSPQ